MKFLLFGRGWIGGQVSELLTKKGVEDEVVWGKSRVDDTEAVEAELKEVKPDRVLCLVGRTHGPGFTTIDYLEQKGKTVENIKDNLYAPVSLALVCQKLGIHMAYLGTGCIFEYSNDHVVNGIGFTSDDKPNFFGSSYSVVKGFTDRLLHQIPCLQLRIRMPITGDRNGRNFVTKITKYAKICSIENSMSVLPILLPIMIDLSKKQHIGTVNLTNKGTISHNRVLELYKQIVDPTFTWENFTPDEQAKILAAGRSNNLLDTSFLDQNYPGLPNIEQAVILALQDMAIGDKVLLANDQISRVTIE
jgi:dTDP-4-dehydrorhamnose reductase